MMSNPANLQAVVFQHAPGTSYFHLMLQPIDGR